MSWLRLAIIDEDYEKELDRVEERGQKPVTKFDPEYEWMMLLVKVLIKQGVPFAEVDKILSTEPFKTIDDVGNIAAKLWTLATVKYRIPKDYLERQLPDSKLKNKGEIMSSWLKAAAPEVRKAMGWLRKADAPGMEGGLPAMPSPVDEAGDVMDAETLSKALKDMIAKHKGQDLPGEVRLLNQALKFVTKFIKKEKEDKKELEEQRKKDEEKAKKEQEKAEKAQKKEQEKAEKRTPKEEKPESKEDAGESFPPEKKEDKPEDKKENPFGK